jgi:hypothetical protein
MKQFYFFVLLVIFALSTNALAGEIDLRINGVGLGTKQATVLRKLGKPSLSRKGGIVPCSDGSTLLTLRYPGLVIELTRDEDEQDFSIFSMKVTSPKWTFSRISVGTNINNVQAKFGQPYHKTKESKLLGLHYNTKGNGGAASFYFQGKKLEEVYWEINFC